jgi:hypothetical protein
MKTLVESLFDNKLIEKDLFDNPAFKQWINQPNTLWYIYYYWESGEEDWLNDFMREDWQVYKPLVDELLDIITNSMGKTYTWYMINFDQYDYSDEVKDKFADEEEFYDMMNDANYEILKKSTGEKDGITKTWFRGPFPKNSNVTGLLQQLEVDFVKSGVVNGGILLTNEDTIMVLAFPKRTPKNILKLFNIN